MQYIQPASTGATRSDESKDCSVRALATAASMHYDDAHDILAYHGRPDRKGANPSTLIGAYVEAGFTNITSFGTTKPARFYVNKFGNNITKTEAGITLKNFCKKYNKGSYIVVYSGHALAVVDGAIIDKGANPANKRVILSFKKTTN